MDYFLALTVNGVLSGAIYALVGVAFVVVFKAGAVLNLSLGEWVMLGARLTGIGMQTLSMPLLPAFGFAAAVLGVVAWGFNKYVLRFLYAGSAIAVLTATLALGSLLRGSVALTLTGVPGEISSPVGQRYFEWGSIIVPLPRLIASSAALVLIAGVMTFFRWTRAGIAIRAVADDRLAAEVCGISSQRHLTLVWVIAAFLCAASGVLWSLDGLGGFSMSLVLIKVLPVVVIGGLTSFAGALVGALVVGLAESYSAGYLDPLVGTGTAGLVAALTVIVMLWVRPSGLFGATSVRRI